MVSDWNAQVVNGMEADDAIAIKATELDHESNHLFVGQRLQAGSLSYV
jgi:hypothetical protein